MSLITKHRPNTLDDFYGNFRLKESLQSIFNREQEDIPNAFLLRGPSGCGKTTLARIIANTLGCDPKDLDYTEMNSADYRGIDTIRAILQRMHYKPWGRSRVWILDEAGQLTPEAQNAMLRALEEPPKHAYFILCTNHPDKLIKELKGRCLGDYEVSYLSERMLCGLLSDVCKKEKKEIPLKILKTIATEALGSPREALKLLDKIIDLDPEQMDKYIKDNEEVPKSKAITVLEPEVIYDQEDIEKIGFLYTQGSAVDVFVKWNCNDICYCQEKRYWYSWNGKLWVKEDQEGREIFQRAKSTIIELIKYAKRTFNPTLEDWANKSYKTTMFASMVKGASKEPAVAIKYNELDANHWLLNCNNGTINLKNGTLQRHDRKDKITKIIPYEYDPDAKCPTWNGFIKRSMGDNSSLEILLQKAVGYSLTGDATLKSNMFFLYGPTDTGKSKFIRAIDALLGDYALADDFETFLSTRNNIRNDLAGMKGKRLVTAVETDSDKKIDAGKVKQITGGDKLRVRFLHKEFFTYEPEFKIWLASNELPQMPSGDDAFWRRIVPIPFNVEIPKDEQDDHILDKFIEELPGILNWALRGLQGCFDSNGNLKLDLPPYILEEKTRLRKEVDHYFAFRHECCEEVKGELTKFGDLYIAYVRFCTQRNIPPASDLTFTKKLTKMGYISVEKTIRGQPARYKVGLKLKQ